MRNLIKEIFTVTYVWRCLNESVFYVNKSATADSRHSYVMHIIAMESIHGAGGARMVYIQLSNWSRLKVLIRSDWFPHENVALTFWYFAQNFGTQSCNYYYFLLFCSNFQKQNFIFNPGGRLLSHGMNEKELENNSVGVCRWVDWIENMLNLGHGGAHHRDRLIDKLIDWKACLTCPSIQRNPVIHSLKFIYHAKIKDMFKRVWRDPSAKAWIFMAFHTR